MREEQERLSGILLVGGPSWVGATYLHSAGYTEQHGSESRIRTRRIVVNSHAPSPRGTSRNVSRFALQLTGPR